MPVFRRLAAACMALATRRRVDADLDDELRAFLDASIEQKLRDGMSRRAATRAARLEIGSMASVKDRVRDAGWESFFESIWQDVRFAFRMLRRSPGFAAAAITTLALGIGGTTAVFSVVNALFMRAPDGVSEPASLRKIFIKRDEGSMQTPQGWAGSWPDYVAMRDLPAFSGVAGYWTPTIIDLGQGDQAGQVRASIVSHEFLNVLGVRPALGRFFVAEDDGADGAHPVAVISHAMWRSRFAAAPEAIGKTLLVNASLVEIVGIAPQHFAGIDTDAVDMWFPSSMAVPLGLGSEGWRLQPMIGVHYVARVARGATDAAAIEQANVALRHSAEAFALDRLDPTPEILTAPLVLAAAPGGTRVGNLSLWLTLVAGLVLVVVCANVANLLLARAAARRRELAVRISIGAGRWRVVRQQLTESVVLALLGGTAGVLLADVAMGLLRQFPLPPAAGRLDARLLVFAFAVSVLTGLLFGVLPALRASRMDPVHGLKESPATGVRMHRARPVLVGLQVALSLILLVGAGLFVRSLQRVATVDAGLDLDRLLTVRIQLRQAGYTPDQMREFFSAAVQRLRTVPGVDRASIVHLEPFHGGSSVAFWRVPGRMSSTEADGGLLALVGPGYFETAGTALLSGRTIGEGDQGQAVAVVNEAAARMMSESANPVGLCIPMNRQVRGGGCTQIIGVVETQRFYYLSDRKDPIVFLPWANAPNAIPYGIPVLLVRTHGDPLHMAPAVKAAVQALRDDLPFVSVQPLTENVRQEIQPFRLGATLFSLFGLLALGVAGVGIAGVLGYYVSERTHEIGVRRALGAPSGAVVNLVLHQSAIPISAGTLAGLGAAFAGTRYLESQLFGISPHDVLSFVTAALLLVMVALIATVVPARRAVRVDPMIALRSE